jgi:hypothetical protein
MRQESLYADSKVQFAGHETFPLRVLWLKKAFDTVQHGAPSKTFQEHEAIARFGVGRNMAMSMHHWALASGLFEETERQIAPTPLGRLLLSDDGLDPFLERTATIWLCHWHIAATPDTTTTAFHAFNALTAFEFDSAALVDELYELVVTKGWRAARGTLKRDVEVFLRSYVRKGDSLNEDAAEPLLAELGLVREARLGGWYEFVRGPKPNLPDGVFAYAVEDFWSRQGGVSTVGAEQICYAPGSPGRVFKLDEDSVITRLMHLAELTNGAWQWTDTAGLRQVQKRSEVDPLALVASAYSARRPAEVAE